MRNCGPMFGWVLLAGYHSCVAASAETVTKSKPTPEHYAALSTSTQVETIQARVVEDSSTEKTTDQESSPKERSEKSTQVAMNGIMWSTKPQTPKASEQQFTTAAYTQRINPLNRVMEIEAPIREDKFLLGNVLIRISTLDAISIQKQRLVELLKPLVRSEVLVTLEATPDSDGYIALTDLVARGFTLSFDSGLVELKLALTVEQRSVGNLSVSNQRSSVVPENLSRPALLSGYVNIRTGIDYTSEDFFQNGETGNPRLDLQSATQWQGTVLENQIMISDGDGITRNGTRFIYDIPENILRVTVGDVNPLRTTMQGGSDLLGMTIEKSYQKLQPGFNIHPTGTSSFRLERPSTVEVMKNGAIIQRLSLRPGDYNMSDLPITTGSNDITLVITDDVGQKRTLNFTVFSGQALLAPGVSEWAISGGITSQIGSQEADLENFYSKLHYAFDIPAITSFYRRGLTSDITSEVHFQADPNVIMSGVNTFFQTKIGYFALGAAGSNVTDYGTGFSATMGYDIASTSNSDYRRGIRLGADYRSNNFMTIGTVEPDNSTAFQLAATYYQDLPWAITSSFSTNYAFGRDSDGDHYGVDMTFARSFNRSLNTGLTFGYDKTANDTPASRAERDGFSAMLHFAYRPDDNSSIDGSYDTRDARAQLAYHTQAENSVGNWNWQAEIDRQHASGEDGNYGLNGSINYSGNRFEGSASHYATMVGIDGNAVEQRSSLTSGTAIAFADGAFALGRPITNSFAIVEPHKNLSSSRIAIGAQSRNSATSDIFGPALVSDLSPYTTTHLPVDTADLPPGYDVGTGSFDVFAHYKSGYRLTVGSDYTVSAIGTLVDDSGTPVALATGEAYEVGEGRHQVQIFTNRAGRFGAQGLRPGRWEVKIATSPSAHYVIDVPKDANGILQLGSIRPALVN